MNAISIALIFFTALCTTATQLLLKGMGSAFTAQAIDLSICGVGKMLLFAVSQPRVVMAVALQGAGFLVWIVVLSREHAGAALGLGGACVYILTAATEWLIFGTKIGTQEFVALCLVSIGAFMLTNAHA